MNFLEFIWIIFTFLECDLEMISVVLPFFAVLISLCATIAAFKSAKESKKASISNLINNLLTEYSSDKYYDANIKLKEWCKKHKCINEKTEIPDSIDRCRRLISHHIYNLCNMRKENLIDEKIFRIVLPIDKAEFVLKYVEPLDKRKRENHDLDMYKFLRTRYPEVK